MTQNASGPVPWLPRVVAFGGGIFFLFAGLWAMIAPTAFFEQSAEFPPYNQHFIQDIGAFQIGLGAVLLLAAVWRRHEALAVALTGVAVGAFAHLVSHVVGRDLGGNPKTDIPFFAILALVLLAGGLLRLRQPR